MALNAAPPLLAGQTSVDYLVSQDCSFITCKIQAGINQPRQHKEGARHRHQWIEHIHRQLLTGHSDPRRDPGSMLFQKLGIFHQEKKEPGAGWGHVADFKHLEGCHGKEGEALPPLEDRVRLTGGSDRE